MENQSEKRSVIIACCVYAHVYDQGLFFLFSI